MKLLKATILFGLIAILWGFTYSDESDPLGEYAYYKLDDSNRRTSDIIRSGYSETEVVAYDSETANYKVRMKYKFKLNPTGTRSGEDHLTVEAYYFSDEFLVELRESGYYETPDFKVRHEGFGNAADTYGTVYEDCDILRFFDIRDSDVNDLEIKAYVHPSVPVLRAVTLDFKGEYNRLRLKAGLDYRP